MRIDNLDYYYKKFKFGEEPFHNLIKKRVRSILLVSTFYDAFIFEQEGRLSDQLFDEYRQLNLSTAPRIISVPTGEKALEKLKTHEVDLVITMLRIGQVTPFELSKKIKEQDPDLPVFLLLNIKNDIMLIDKFSEKMKYIDNVFSWSGDSKIFLAMVKYIEDRWNVKADTANSSVRVILLVEDSIQYYSMFLPVLYKVIMRQTQKLIKEEINDHNKLLRRRARPKILLCHTYEDALRIYEQYKEFIITIISDVKFHSRGELDKNAGIKLVKYLQQQNKSIPILLQSSEEKNRLSAEELQVHFLQKYSDKLLHDLQDFVVTNLGYGDFIFRDSKGKEIQKADSMLEFEEKLKSIPIESILYHARNNHFSIWLVAHGEFLVANRMAPLQIEDFESNEEIRNYLINCFKEVRYLRYRGNVVEYDANFLKINDGIIQLAGGSLGGKGRGLAFLNSLIVAMEYDQEFQDVKISIPRTYIIGTDAFDDFIQQSRIDAKLRDLSDQQIKKMFKNKKINTGLKNKLINLLRDVKKPLAVRSSGLLEDSQTQPFAGIYETYMIPNNDPDIEVRLQQLTDAIKMVYASVYQSTARNYIKSTNYKFEEEKMAVIIQEIVGTEFDHYYYPHISGVAQSYNYYPVFDFKNTDGIANLALGLGKTVVDGHQSFSFCPAYPKVEILQPQDYWGQSQRSFLALDLKKQNFNILKGEQITYATLDTEIAEKQGALVHLASSWDAQNLRIVDSLAKPGYRIIKFANILKFNYFPLAKILSDIMEIGEKAMGVPVEIEFAVKLPSVKSKKKIEFYLLQIRPLTVNRRAIEVSLAEAPEDKIIAYSEKSLGNGVIKAIRDIVFFKPEIFDKTRTMQMADEIEQINKKLRDQNRKSILIGPGRWGTKDRFLGIPVGWNQIDAAKVIIEASIPDFEVEASQGSHFFHNVVSLGVGYFNISCRSKIDFINWDLLQKLPVKEETKTFIHLQFAQPLHVKIDGRSGKSIIYIPSQPK